MAEVSARRGEQQVFMERSAQESEEMISGILCSHSAETPSLQFRFLPDAG
jgi:hypothetical protein